MVSENQNEGTVVEIPFLSRQNASAHLNGSRPQNRRSACGWLEARRTARRQYRIVMPLLHHYQRQLHQSSHPHQSFFFAAACTRRPCQRLFPCLLAATCWRRLLRIAHNDIKCLVSRRAHLWLSYRHIGAWRIRQSRRPRLLATYPHASALFCAFIAASPHLAPLSWQLRHHAASHYMSLPAVTYCPIWHLCLLCAQLPGHHLATSSFISFLAQHLLSWVLLDG